MGFVTCIGYQPRVMTDEEYRPLTTQQKIKYLKDHKRHETIQLKRFRNLRNWALVSMVLGGSNTYSLARAEFDNARVQIRATKKARNNHIQALRNLKQCTQ